MSSLWFTYVDAELTAQAEEGVVVGNPGGRDHRRHENVDFDRFAETVSDMEGLFATTTDDLFVMGTSTATVQAVADVSSEEALRASEDLNVVAVGNASSVVAAWTEAINGGLEWEGSWKAENSVDNLVDDVSGDAATVTVETRGQDRIRDGDELRRLAEEAVSIADAFEGATARMPPSG